MSIEEAKHHLKKYGKDKEIIEFAVSSATIELAAKALNTEENKIAKTLAFKTKDKVLLIVTAGNMKIDSRKYKSEFNCKAEMISKEKLNQYVGHECGGICPFGIRENIEVYLDISLKKYDYIFPACGSSNSAIKLTPVELEKISQACKWIDVCKEK